MMNYLYIVHVYIIYYGVGYIRKKQHLLHCTIHQPTKCINEKHDAVIITGVALAHNNFATRVERVTSQSEAPERHNYSRSIDRDLIYRSTCKYILLWSTLGRKQHLLH